MKKLLIIPPMVIFTFLAFLAKDVHASFKDDFFSKTCNSRNKFYRSIGRVFSKCEDSDDDDRNEGHGGNPSPSVAPTLTITPTPASCIQCAEVDPQVGDNTEGYVPYWNGSALVMGSIFDDFANGRVGIGTTSPNEQLELTGNIRIPQTSTSVGIVYMDTNPFIHAYGILGTTNANFYAGYQAGNFTNISLGNNVGVGLSTLRKLEGGSGETAVGAGALREVTSGSLNTAVGSGAMREHTTGSYNTALGNNALPLNDSGDNNTAIGQNSLYFSTGSGNTALGKGAGIDLVTGDDNIFIKHVGVDGDSGVVRIGTAGTHVKTFISGVTGVTTDVADAVGVMVDSAGQLGTISSSRRYKTNIFDIGNITNRLMRLRPVTFTYKSDESDTPQYGLIAEEVARVFPELVVYKNGLPETIRYQFLSSMLLNEVQVQKKEIADLRARIELLEAVKN